MRSVLCGTERNWYVRVLGQFYLKSTWLPDIGVSPLCEKVGDGGSAVVGYLYVVMECYCFDWTEARVAVA